MIKYIFYTCLLHVIAGHLFALAPSSAFSSPHKHLALAKEGLPLPLETYFLFTDSKNKGMSDGCIAMERSTGERYILKRLNFTDTTTYENWRTWDQWISSRLLHEAGVLVPEDIVVQDINKLLYIASPLLPRTKDLPASDYLKMPQHIQDSLAVSVPMHAWLGNRDLVSIKGENFVVDNDKNIYHVDLGNTLYAGMRSTYPNGYTKSTQDHPSEDVHNFTQDNVLEFLPVKDQGYFFSSSRGKWKVTNRAAIDAFFQTHLRNPALLKEGVAKVAAISDKTIEKAVSQTGLNEKQKQLRITALKKRRDDLVEYVAKTYGKNWVQEEHLAQVWQRVLFYDQCFQSDESFRDDFWHYAGILRHAVKPNITWNKEKNTYTISFAFADDAASAQRQHLIKSLQSLDLDLKLSATNTLTIESKDLLDKGRLQKALQQRLIAQSFDQFHQSWDYPRNKHTVRIGDRDIEIILPSTVLTETYVSRLRHSLGWMSFHLEIRGSTLIIHNAPDIVCTTIVNHPGARKTAIVSENEEGQILVGRLFKHRRSTRLETGGGSAIRKRDLRRFYNPPLAALEEGAEELGQTMLNPESLIPIGNSVPMQPLTNIFLSPPHNNGAFLGDDYEVDEFDPQTIDYRNLSDIPLSLYSSTWYYLDFYEKQLQRCLMELGWTDIVVEVGKKPGHYGELYFHVAESAFLKSALLEKTIADKDTPKNRKEAYDKELGKDIANHKEFGTQIIQSLSQALQNIYGSSSVQESSSHQIIATQAYDRTILTVTGINPRIALSKLKTCSRVVSIPVEVTIINSSEKLNVTLKLPLTDAFDRLSELFVPLSLSSLVIKGLDHPETLMKSKQDWANFVNQKSWNNSYHISVTLNPQKNSQHKPLLYA